MSNQRSIIANLILGISLMLTGCVPSQAPEIDANRTSTLPPTMAPTNTPSPTATPPPTPTMTPTPVSFTNAIGQGTVKELETYGKGRIQASSFSPDGSTFAAVTRRGVHIFKALTWEEISYIPAAPGVNIQFVRFSRDGSLFAGGDSAGNVTFWDTQTWDVRQVIAAGKSPITGLDISPDNMTCVTIGDKKVVALWNLESGEQVKSMTRANDTGSVYFSHDGSWIMLSEPAGQGDLTTWKADDLTFINRLHQLGRRPPNQAISPFSDVVASYTHTTLNIHDFENERDYVFKDVFGVFDKVQMAFVNDVTLFVKSNYADSYRLYDLRTGSMREEPMEELPKLKSKNPDIRLITEEEEIKSLGFDPYPKIVAVSPQGDRLILGEGIFDLTMESMSKPNMVNDSDLWNNSVILDNGYVGVVDPSQPEFPKKDKKGNLIISTMDFKDMTMVDKILFSYDLPDGIQNTAISPDGTMVAAGLYDGSVYFWDVQTSELIGSVRAHNKVFEVFGLYGSIRDIIFSRDASLFATSGFDKTIKVWSAKDFSLVSTFYGSMPAFSPDGENLAYADSNNRIQVVSLNDNSNSIVFEGHSDLVTGLLFSADGSLVISGSRDQTVKVWSIAEQSLLMELPQAYMISSMALSPDGTLLYTTTLDGVISVWGNEPN